MPVWEEDIKAERWRRVFSISRGERRKEEISREREKGEQRYECEGY